MEKEGLLSCVELGREKKITRDKQTNLAFIVVTLVPLPHHQLFLFKSALALL